MFILYLFVTLIQLIIAFEPSCTTCKFFIPHETNNSPDLGLCTFFKDKVYYDNGNEVLIGNLAIHCRKNENLCGKSGFLYEPINDINNKNDKNDNEIFEKYENVKNLCCGEFTDKKDLDELEKLEKDMLEIFQKMRKHNTMRVYKNSKDLYKLFKKK